MARTRTLPALLTCIYPRRWSHIRGIICLYLADANLYAIYVYAMCIRVSIYIYCAAAAAVTSLPRGGCLLLYMYKHHRYIICRYARILLSCVLYAVRTRKQRVHEVSLAGSSNDKRSRAAHNQYIGIRVYIIIYTNIYIGIGKRRPVHIEIDVDRETAACVRICALCTDCLFL